MGSTGGNLTCLRCGACGKGRGGLCGAVAVTNVARQVGHGVGHLGSTQQVQRAGGQLLSLHSLPVYL